MKIAHVHWSMATGGIETMLADIVSIQARENEVALFVINNRITDSIIEKIDKRVKIYYLNRQVGSKSIFPIIKLNFLLWKFNPDVIHTHATREVDLLFFQKAPKVRTIHRIGDECKEYPKFKALIAISDAVRDFTKGQGYEAETIVNGISIDNIDKKTDYNRGKNFHFVQVSRLMHTCKGQDVLIRALSVVKYKYNKTNFIMHFIGMGESEQILRKMVSELNLENNIVFEGNKTQKYIYSNLKTFDAFIQPSVNEGFGLTIAEAISAKLPVIISNLPGPMEIIDNGKYGRYFHTGNSEELAKCINDFMERPVDIELIEKAYAFVQNNFDVIVTANKYVDVYRRIIK